MAKKSIFVGLALLLARTASAAPFENLNFDSSSRSQSLASIAPWQATDYGGTSSTVAFNAFLLSANVTLLGGTLDNIDFNPEGPAVIQMFMGPVSIEQTGTIPADTQSIRFWTNKWPPGSLVMTLNGQAIPLQQIAETHGIVELSGAVSDYAGRDTQLQFSEVNLPLNSTFIDIDNVTFSPEQVPEPANAAAIGLVCLATQRRKPPSSRWRLSVLRV